MLVELFLGLFKPPVFWQLRSGWSGLRRSGGRPCSSAPSSPSAPSGRPRCNVGSPRPDDHSDPARECQDRTMRGHPISPNLVQLSLQQPDPLLQGHPGPPLPLQLVLHLLHLLALLLQQNLAMTRSIKVLLEKQGKFFLRITTCLEKTRLGHLLAHVDDPSLGSRA